jgi:hypothetical protein
MSPQAAGCWTANQARSGAVSQPMKSMSGAVLPAALRKPQASRDTDWSA